MINTLINQRYKIKQQIGSGGMGEIYLAEDMRQSKQVALKTIKFNGNAPETALKKFNYEFKLLSKLKHPNLIEVYDFGFLKAAESVNKYFYTMEYVDGNNFLAETESLDWANEEDIKKFYNYLVQICQGLEYIHSQGLIHRDIKPENIIIKWADEAPNVKIMDFGLAQQIGEGDRSVIGGTLLYMAPEIIKEQGFDHRADLYSLGLVLYYAITRRHPFAADDITAILKHHIETIPKSPQTIHPQIPEPLQQIITKLLSKKPFERYSSANEVIRALNDMTDQSFPIESKETRISYVTSGYFVGRERELSALKKFADSAFLGKADTNLILLKGESGIGKSRLMREFRIHCQLNQKGFYEGKASKNANFIYKPIQDIILQLLPSAPKSFMEEYADEFAKILPADVYENIYHCKPETCEENSRELKELRLFNKISDFIDQIAQIKPFILFFDDINYYDPVLLNMITYLARSISGLPILMILSYRTKVLAENETAKKSVKIISDLSNCKTLELTPLNSKKTFEMINSMFQNEKISQILFNKIRKLSAGNPRWILEIMKSLIEKEIIYPGLGGWELAENKLSEITIPDKLSDIIINRLNGLTEYDQNILKILSILGSEFDINLMYQLINFDSNKLFSAFERLTRRGIIKSKDGHFYNFTNPKILETIIETLTENEKSQLHRSIGETLKKIYDTEEDEHIEEIAYHFVNTGKPELYKDYVYPAAEKMRERYANHKAIEFYRYSLNVLADNEVEKRTEIIYKIADIQQFIGENDEALEKYQELIKFENIRADCDRYVRILQRISDIHSMRSQYDKSEDILQQGLTRIPQHDAINRAYLYRSLAVLDLRRGNYDASISLLEKAFSLIKEINTERAELEMGGIHHSWGTACYYKGEIQSAYEHWLNALHAYQKYNKKVAIVKILNNLAAYYHHEGEPQNSVEQWEKGLKLSEDVGDIETAAIICINLATIQNTLQNHDKSLLYAQKSHNLYRKIGNWIGEINALLKIGHGISNLKKPSEATQYYEEALKRSQRLDNKPLLSVAKRALGENYYALGDYSNAIRLKKESLVLKKELSEKIGIMGLIFDLGNVYNNLGDIETAKSYIEPEIEAIENFNNKEFLLNGYGYYASILLKENALDKVENLIQKMENLLDEFSTEQKNLQYKIWKIRAEICVRQEKFDQALEFCDNMIEYASSKNINHLLGYAYYLKGISTGGKAGLSIMEKAQNIAEEREDYELQWRVYHQRGRLYHLKNKLGKAQNEYKQAQQLLAFLATRIDDEDLQTRYMQREQVKNLEMDNAFLQSQINEKRGKMAQNEIDQIIKGITTFSEEDNFEGNLRNIVLLYQEKEAEVDKLRREHRNFEMLFEASKIINSSIELDEVLNRVMDMALDITQAERGFLIMFDKVGELHMQVIRNMNKDILTSEESRASTTIVNRVLEEGKSVYTNDAQLDKRFNTAASIMELNLRTIICSPLRIKDRIIGAIYVDNRMIEDDFMQQSLPLIETLADNAAIAIENAKLYEEKKKKQQIEQELHFANKIQNHLLPHEIPDLNELNVYGVMIPAREVGGDYYDFIVRDENDAIISIGDVSGKGFSAGILMAGARMIIRSLAETLNSPREILSRANKVLERDLKSYRFMTMLLLHWNGKYLSWSSAGHEHIIHFNSKTQKCSILKSKGLALGLREDIHDSLTEKKLELKSGDTLVLYTDGITDAIDKKGERFGKDRLIQIVEQNGHLHPKDVSKEILLNAHKFIGDNELFDDITLVTIQKD